LLQSRAKERVAAE
jgi:hypothetical protein